MADSTEGSGRNPSPRAVGYDEGAFVKGYLAALADIGGAHTTARTAVIWADLEAAARRAFDDPGWLDRLDLLGMQTAHLRPARSRPERRGFIYVLWDRARDLYKVGWSSNVERRKASVEKASGAALEVIAACDGTMREERELHERMDAFRVHGEWFRPNSILEGWLA